MIINLTLDPTAATAFPSGLASLPSNWLNPLLQAKTILENAFTDNITVNIQVGYGEVMFDNSQPGNKKVNPDVTSGGEGGPQFGSLVNYSTVITDLKAHDPTNTVDTDAYNSLKGAPAGHDQIDVSPAIAKALGLASATDSGLDGSVGFAAVENLPGQTLSVGLALHELTHAMGRAALLATGFQSGGSPVIGIEDLFRYSSQTNPPTNQFNDTSGVYFSVDSGKTNLANFDFTPTVPDNLGHDPGDFTNIIPDDPFNENTGLSNNLSDFDINLMGILGFKHAPVPGFPVQPPAPSLTHRVEVDITRVLQLISGDTSILGIPDNTDFYAKIFIGVDDSTGKQTSVETDFGDHDHTISDSDFTPVAGSAAPGAPWSASANILDRQTVVPIRIELWDSDGGLNFRDNAVDITSGPSTQFLSLTLDRTTGHLTSPDLPGLVDANHGVSEGTDANNDGGTAHIEFNVSVLGVLQEALVVNGSDLTIEGDQFTDRNDNIVIDKTAAGGLKVTINGNTVEYAPGQITSLTINTGSGTNTVSLLTPFSFTLNGGGTDKLILGPNLPPATFTPDPSGVPDFGVVNIGDTHVQLNSVEAVQNLAPAISSLNLTASTINENGFVSLIGQFIDAGSLSTETVTVDWGDGTTDTVLQNAAGQRVFVDTHQYLDDNPTGTPSDSYNITATVTDNDNLSASSTTSVTVNNVPPVITSVSSGATASNLAKEGQPVSFQGAFTDVGTQDTHTVTIDYSDGTGPHSAQVTEAGGSGTFSDSHVFASGGIYPVSVAVTDDDTGQANTSTQAFVTGFGIHTFNGVTVLQGVGTNQSDTMVVKQHKDTLDVSASFLDGRRSFSTVGLDRIELYGLDGNDTLDVRNTTLPVILDGGNGDDTLRAGDGKDTLIGGAGDDRLFGGKGDDTFIGGPGNDFMQGGSGTNTADYSAETASVTVNLATHQATGASIGNDTLISIDNVIGGSADDTFIDGRGEGRAGYSFNGAGGTNTAVFHGDSSNYSIVTSLASDGLLHTAVVDHGAAGDAPVDLVNVQRLQFADQTVANMANNALLGNYMASAFVAGSDGHGGTLVSETAQTASQTPLLTHPHA